MRFREDGDVSEAMCHHCNTIRPGFNYYPEADRYACRVCGCTSKLDEIYGQPLPPTPQERLNAMREKVPSVAESNRSIAVSQATIAGALTEIAREMAMARQEREKAAEIEHVRRTYQSQVDASYQRWPGEAKEQIRKWNLWPF